MRYQDIRIPESLAGAGYLAVMSDRVVCGIYQGGMRFQYYDPGQSATAQLEDLEEKLLELRVFSQQEEFRAVRPYRGMEFKVRHIDDTLDLPPHFDEVHYLDQDRNRTKKLSGDYTAFTATGGGQYILPGDEHTCRVQVRTYLTESPESNGIQLPGDWRIVAFGSDDPAAKGAE